MRPISRITPALPAQDMKTYSIIAPPDTHFQNVPCGDANCQNYLNGWKTYIDPTTELGQQQAHYIEKQSGRKYVKEADGSYLFEAGQQCFQVHRVRMDRPEIYLVKDGDWRASQNVRKHANADDWVDDFQNHQDKLSQTLEKS